MLTHQTRWTIEKISRRLELIQPMVYRRKVPIEAFRYLSLGTTSESAGPIAPELVQPNLKDSGWSRLAPPTLWGEWRTNFILRARFRVPPEWGQAKPVALHLPLGDAGEFEHPEALAYLDGTPYAAVDRHHQEILLPEDWLAAHAAGGRPVLLALHGWTGIGGDLWDVPERRLYARECSVVQIDPPTRQFISLARVALGIAQYLDENHPSRSRLLNALDQAFNLLDTRHPLGEGFYASLPPALTALQMGIEESGPPMDVEIVAAGHAHIDVAWLWTLNQTRRKAGRTFHNVLRLMEQFPEFRFAQSQPQLYEFVRQDYPELFAAIQQRVVQGRWEPIGGMWVEADCNLSGAESLARQFLLGRRFFREHFGAGAESPVLWLPDVFGYAWNLPQLIRQAGLEYFFTIKIGWNQYNRMPYDSFWWQGLDGTRILTHFSTTPEDSSAYASTYNAEMTPRQPLRTWENFQQKELQHSLLMAYGFGDGGGGPTRQMLENACLMAQFPASPQVYFGKAGDFFRRLEAESGAVLPTWNGELYLEYHRGTYTTQARNKRLNRKCEFLLHDAEFLAAAAAQQETSYAYPQAELQRAWELVCLNQFHDIIPGSSIGEVYIESAIQYGEVHRLAEEVRQSALAALANIRGSQWLVANPTSFHRQDLAYYPGNPMDLPEGIRWQAANGHSGAVSGAWLALSEIPPYSVVGLPTSEPIATESQNVHVTPERLENAWLLVDLDSKGEIRRIYDKVSRRELLPPGRLANQWLAFEDRPLNWDAWDIDIYYEDRHWLAEPAESIRVVEAGPLRGTLEVQRRILNSPYTQRISLVYNSPRLDFHTRIEWRERHILLKVAFPIDVLATSATYEIQWGNVQRPTHSNTSWDWARFESCAHKWVDLSEGDYGASLLNDCKYGHDVQGNTIRLTLLRSPGMPDPQADLGEHEFSYSLLPHAGNWGADTLREAYALNDPLVVFRSGQDINPSAGRASAPGGGEASFVSVDTSNVIIETVKQAEDGQGVVVRLYECMRRRQQVRLQAGFVLRAAQRVNLLEEVTEELPVNGQQVSFPIKPYEIITLRLHPGS
jgi:alpha-mannosidase